MLVQAHRGNSGHAPENTLAAFRSAVSANADGIECDIHMTSDGYFVVCHDTAIDRTSNGKGSISDMTLEQLKQYDFGFKFSEKFKNEKIPALEEMLSIVRDMKVINIEIKEFAGNVNSKESSYAKLCKILYEFNILDKTIISSFDASSLQKVIDEDKNIYTAYLCDLKNPQIDTIATALSLKCKAIHPLHSNITEAYVKEAKQAGLAVNVWTANTESEILRCLNLGCDAVITNEPELAKKTINK